MEIKLVLWSACLAAVIVTAYAADKVGVCPSPTAPRAGQQSQQGRQHGNNNNQGSPGGTGCEIACSKDRDCQGTLKCCSNYCGGRSCIQPDTSGGGSSSLKPGSCPANVNQLVCRRECERDSDCRGNNKCCRTKCGTGTACSDPLTTSTTTTRRPSHGQKPGTCKPGLAQFSCATECQRDSDCRSDLKCCTTVCGGKMCSSPQESLTTTTRRPGSGGARPGCPVPSEHPGQYICRSECSRNGDCRGNSKCCENKCGALVCTAPNQG